MNNYEWMPCMNCSRMSDMYQQPMMQQPEMEMEMDRDMDMEMEMEMQEEHLKSMYPDIYLMVMPMVKQHCDKHEEEHGKMHCPEHEHIKDMRDKIYKQIEGDLDEHCGEEDEDEHDDKNRIRRYGRRNAVKDLIGVLLLNELIGRRRRRRRRRPRPRPHYGWY